MVERKSNTITISMLIERLSLIVLIKIHHMKGAMKMLKDAYQRIVYLRKQKKWSQVELSQKMGISKSTMNKIESGSRKISAAEVKKLAKIFDVPTDFLLGIHDTPLDVNQENQLDIQLLLESNAKLSYAEEGLLTEEDKLMIDDIIGGYIWKKKQRIASKK